MTYEKDLKKLITARLTQFSVESWTFAKTELKRARNEGLYQRGPILNFLSKTCRSITVGSALDDGDFTPFNSPLMDPRHWLEEILRSIFYKSRTFLAVGMTGQLQTHDVSRIHLLDIIMFVLGRIMNSSSEPVRISAVVISVTSILMTDFGDQMCWWQVWDIGDRFNTLRKSST